MAYYNRELTVIAKRLRKNCSCSEILMWKHLRNRKMLGFRFYRKKPIDEFIVDYYCHKLNLIIELTQSGNRLRDALDSGRDQILNAMGFNILRFTNTEVETNPDKVLMAIRAWITQYQVSRK